MVSFPSNNLLRLHDILFSIFISKPLQGAVIPSFTNTLSSMSGSSASVSGSAPAAMALPELEQTLATLISHRSVLGYLVLSRTSEPVSIIRYAGVVFEGEQGKKYAQAVKRIVDTCTSGLQDVGGGESVRFLWFIDALFLIALDSLSPSLLKKDQVRFMRIRTIRHELLVSPG